MILHAVACNFAYGQSTGLSVRRLSHGFVLARKRVRIRHVHAALVAAHVVHGDVGAREFRQAQGLRTEVRERRRVAETDLDVLFDAESATRLAVEQQRLGFDPAHRGGELPGEQFRQEQTAELLVIGGVGVPHGRVLQRLADALGRYHVEDLRRELAGHLERHGHEVRNVAADEASAVVDVLGQQRVELVAELRHALPEQRGVERHVDAGHEHERRLAARFLGAAVRIRL